MHAEHSARKTKLDDVEGPKEVSGWAFLEEAVLTGKEGECLRNDGDLEVDAHVELVVVDVLAAA